MGPMVGYHPCQNFGNIRDYYEKLRGLLAQKGALLVCSSTAGPLVSSLEDALPWTWPDDTGHMREIIFSHPSLVHKLLKVKASTQAMS
jgi:hypothetical protein